MHFELKNEKKDMKKIIQIFLVLVFLSLGTIGAQQKGNAKTVTVESTIKSENGQPIANALVFGKEGAVVVKSNSEGQFRITVPVGTQLLIEADGYESLVIAQASINKKDGVLLKSTPFMMGEKDDVNIAYGKTKKANLLGDITAVKPSDFVAYDNTQYLPDALIGRVAGLIGSGNIRGLGDALVVLNGIPRYSNILDVNLNMEEIDQITVLKDAGAVALYGSQARNGVIIITTKKGVANKRTINVTAQFGMATPKALPQYLGSADYMELYNEASVNDGLPLKYDATTIENYRTGNKYRYPSIDYYSSDYIKSFRTSSKVLTEFSGGNENTTFYANVGWDQNGSLLNYGAGKNATRNRFNTRANVDFKISDYIKSSVDVAGVFEFNNEPVSNYYEWASTTRPHLYTPLLPIDLIRNTPDNWNFIHSRKNDISGQFLLGGNNQVKTNAIADVYVGGSNQAVKRTMQFNNTIDFDLRMITPGLSFKTNIGFDFYNSYNQSVNNTYSVYEPTWSAVSDSIISMVQYGTDTKPGTQNLNNPDFIRRTAFSGQLDYKRTFANNHNVDATLLGFTNNVKINGTLQESKYSHIGLRAGYNYKNTYYIDYSSAYVHSVLLPKNSRGDLSPTLSLGWVLSKESFLSALKNVDYLKLKASAGVINNDMSIDGIYYYENVYGTSGSYAWADGLYTNTGTVSLRGANNLLGYEKRKEINVGVEGLFFNKSLSVDVNLFKTLISDKIVQRTSHYPNYLTDYIPYSNFGIDAYTGAELSLNYSKKIGDFGFDIGFTGMYWGSKVIEKDELYANDYQNRTGRPVDAYFGLVSEGLFKDQADISGHAFQTYGDVKPGDVKYKDQNDDGVIDNNDQVQIGRWQAPVIGGVNLKLTYKNFSLFAIGIGSFGSDAFISNSYYLPDGDDKYSVIALQRWTELTKESANYPRLSTKTNTNNAQRSTQFMYNNDIFTINRVQITYLMPEKVCKILNMQNLSIYLNGSGLATFSKYADVKDLNIGAEPQYRSLALGIRSNF